MACHKATLMGNNANTNTMVTASLSPALPLLDYLILVSAPIPSPAPPLVTTGNTIPFSSSNSTSNNNNRMGGTGSTGGTGGSSGSGGGSGSGSGEGSKGPLPP